MTVIIFLLVLAALIFVHELGHFLLAKWNGIRVDEFKIGFGPQLFSWGTGETKYGLNLVPFGGYVKIHGENPDEDSINGPDKDRSFVHKARWRQVSVLVAGVVFNFLFAWILYVAVFTVGVSATKEGFEKYADRFENERIMITYVRSGSPAEKAGLKPGDVLLNISHDQSESISKMSISEIQDAINTSKDKPLYANINRQTGTTSILVTPEAGLVADRYAIGISMDEAVDIRLPFLAAVHMGARYTLVMIRDTTVGLYEFLKDTFKGDSNFSDITGPVGIAGIVGDAAGMGFSYLIMITALISINLGVINFMPFPALDGGRILFALIEGIIRRPIRPVFANTANAIGFVLLMALMLIVTYKDIAKLIP